jgi:hypothetical protein
MRWVKELRLVAELASILPLVLQEPSWEALSLSPFSSPFSGPIS